MGSFTVVFDACVLYPAPLRDLLLRIAVSGVVRARWTEQILDEMVRSILRNRPDLTPESLLRTRELMCSAVPDCLVYRYESLLEMIALPDPDDRHVVAAAVQCGAEAIVTLNRRDFPDHEVTKWGIEIKHPDDFVMESIAIAPVTVARCLREQAAALSSPPQTVEEVLGRLRICGLAQSSVRLRELLGEAGLT